MRALFIDILNLSIVSSWLILAVLALRLVLKRVAPRWTVCLLWGLVAISLIVPFSFESPVSLVPNREAVVYTGAEEAPKAEEPKEEAPTVTVPQSPVVSAPAIPVIRPNKLQVQSGITSLDDSINKVVSPKPEEAANSVDRGTLAVELGGYIWVAGTVFLLAYFVISLALLKRSLSTAVSESKGVYRGDRVGSPFVLGFISPKVYLPFGLSEENQSYVLRHEHAHIKRLDHLVKPLAFFILALHWFNPLVWVSYILLCRDIEYACDEKVIKELNTEERKAYATALLACGVKGRSAMSCPVAFGEISVKQRIKKALSYKKPALWIIIAVIVTAAVLALCFLSTPENKEQGGESESTEQSGESESGDEEAHLGTWRCDDDSAGVSSISFKPNGTGTIVVDDVAYKFSWHRHEETEDKKLYISIDAPVYVSSAWGNGVEYKVDGDSLTLRLKDGDHRFTKTTDTQIKLVGTWYAADHSIMLKEDGTGVVYKDGALTSVSWSLSDNSLTISNGSEEKSDKFAVLSNGASLSWNGVVYSSTFSGQSNSKYDSALIGTWYGYDVKSGETCYVFQADGTGSITSEGVTLGTKWQTEDGTLLFTVDMQSTVGVGATLRGSYRVEGDSLYLELDGVEEVLTKTPNKLGGNLQLVGEWVDPDAVFEDGVLADYTCKIEFDINGTCSYITDDGYTCFLWTEIDDGVIQLEYSDGEKIKINYTMEGDTLSLSYGDKTGTFIFVEASDPTVDTTDMLGGDDALADSWIIDDGGSQLELLLNADGTGVANARSIGMDVNWWASEGNLCVFSPQSREIYFSGPYYLEGDCFYLCESNYMECYVRKDSGLSSYILEISARDTMPEGDDYVICDLKGAEFITIIATADLNNFRFAKTYASFRGEPCEINGIPYEFGKLGAWETFVGVTNLGDIVSDHCVLFTDPNGNEQCLKLWYTESQTSGSPSSPEYLYSFEYAVLD